MIFVLTEFLFTYLLFENDFEKNAVFDRLTIFLGWDRWKEKMA